MATKKEISDLRKVLEQIALALKVELRSSGNEADMSFAVGKGRPMRVSLSTRIADSRVEKEIFRIFDLQKNNPALPLTLIEWRAARHGGSAGKRAQKEPCREVETATVITSVAEIPAVSTLEYRKSATHRTALPGFAAFEEKAARIKPRIPKPAVQPQLPAAAPCPVTAQGRQTQTHQPKPVVVDYEKAAAEVLKVYLKLSDDEKKALLPPPEPIPQAQPKPIAERILRKVGSSIMTRFLKTQPVTRMRLFPVNNDPIIKRPVADATVAALIKAAKDAGASMTIDQVNAGLRVYEAADEQIKNMMRQSLETTLKSGQIGLKMGLRAQDVRTARVTILRNMARAMTGGMTPAT